jgi:hypothetical protein
MILKIILLNDLTFAIHLVFLNAFSYRFHFSGWSNVLPNYFSPYEWRLGVSLLTQPIPFL